MPGAFDRKGFWKFLRDRAVRLGIPSLLFMLLLHPITVYWLLRNFAEHSRRSLFQAYWSYVSSGRFLRESGPMWFAVALLLFSLVYGIVRLVSRDTPRIEPDAALPDHGQVVGLAALMGLLE